MSTAAAADRPSGPAPPPRRRRRSRLLAGPLAVLALVASLLAVPAATSPDAAEAAEDVRWAKVSAGYAHTCAVDTAGLAWCWGDNTRGQLGDGTTTDRHSPTLVPGLDGVTDISAGGDHTCAAAAGLAYCWGANSYGQLGNNDWDDSHSPTPVSIFGGDVFAGVTDISAGGDHTCAVASSVAYCWGRNDDGQIGNGTTYTHYEPTWVSAFGPEGWNPLGLLPLARVTDISAGDAHTCAVAAGGVSLCWGHDDGRLGILPCYYVYCNGYDHTTPTPTGGPFGLVGSGVRISAGGAHTCAVENWGIDAFCWGSDIYGQRGDGTNNDRWVRYDIVPTVISAGFHHTCAATNGSSVLTVEGAAPYCWGANASGQVGDGTTTDRDTPAAVSGLETVVDISAGGSDEVTAHTCAVDDGGAAWCWGDNSSGQLGDGTTTDRTTPTQVPLPNLNEKVNEVEEEVFGLIPPVPPIPDAEEEVGKAIDLVFGLVPDDIVKIEPPRIGESESDQCRVAGGDDSRIVDTTTEGVRTFVYTYQPTDDEVWLCARVEDTSTGDGYGGRLRATPAEADPQVTGVPGTPSTDGDSTACTTTTPNDVPGSHPISSGGLGPVDYMVDAYADDDEVWVCLQAGSSDHRVVVPLGSGTPGVQSGTVAYWHPDEGTPGS